MQIAHHFGEEVSVGPLPREDAGGISYAKAERMIGYRPAHTWRDYLGEDGRAHARLTSCMPRLAALGADKVAAYRGIEDEVNAALRTGHVAVDIVTTPPGAIGTASSAWLPTSSTRSDGRWNRRSMFTRARSFVV